MLTVKVLGSNCNKCRRLKQKVEMVVSKYQIEAEVIEVQDIHQMLHYGYFGVPALVINEKLVHFGNIPDETQLLKLLKDFL